MATKIKQIEFIKQVYPAAYSLYVEKDSIHPYFVTAQAALETGWNADGIGNNIFGITKGSWTGKTQLVLTTEYFNTPAKSFKAPEEIVSITPVVDGRYKYRVYRQFRVYDRLEDCLDDHIAVLKNSGYADAWPLRKDAREFARRIVDKTGSRYATDPNYATVMCSVIDTIENRIKDIRNEMGHTDNGDNIFFRL
jgi:flagellar protein FlgJ